MRKTLLWLIIAWAAGCAVILSVHCEASSIRATKFRFGEVSVRFVPVGKSGKLLSEDCTAKKCEAYQALLKASAKGFESLLRYPSIDIGAAICQLSFAGSIQIDSGDHGQAFSFCQFPDGSMVENHVLLEAAKKNDLGVEQEL